jgi:hypothetical protein
MAIALRGHSVINTGSVAVPASSPAATPSPQVGDFCLIWVVGRSSLSTFTATGFTAVTAVQGTFGAMQLLWRPIDGSESWPITVTVSNSVGFCGFCLAYSGVDSSHFDPNPTSGQNNASSANVTPPSITPVNSGDTIVWFGGSRSAASGGVPNTITPPGGTTPTFTTENAMIVTSCATQFNVGAIVADGVWASSGAIQKIGSVTACINAALQVSLKPAPVSAGFSGWGIPYK